jgi:hypothetical protein
MKTKKSAKAVAMIFAIGIVQMAFAPQAKADWWDDFVQPNLNTIRSNTFGRMFNQTFVAYLDGQTLENIKAQNGGDYEAVLTDWCNNAVASSEYSHKVNMPYIGSTWRIENGRVNCYSRNNNF